MSYVWQINRRDRAKISNLFSIMSETTIRLLLPTKLFSVFFTMRLLPGVLRFACSTGETQFSANFCGEIAELSLCLTNFCVATICLTKKCLFGNGLKKNVHYPPNNKQPDILFSELMHFQSICFTP